MSSKVYGSEDNANFGLDLTPGNKCLLAGVPGITPDKLNKENLEQLLGNYTPVITVSSSSASELRSSKFMNPFNDTNSSELRNSKIMNNDGLQSSNSSNLQYLLPPISFNDNNRGKHEKEEVEFFDKNNQLFVRGMKCVLQSSRNLPHNADNLLVSSPITQNQDVVIDKDLLTSEADYNDHLYPWIPKQESEGCDSFVESTLVKQHEETSAEKLSYIEKDRSIQETGIKSPVPGYELESDTNEISIKKKRLTKKKKRKNNISKTLPLTILIKPEHLRKEINKLLKKKPDKLIDDTVLHSGDLLDQDSTEYITKEDDEYLPACKITRSKSRKNRISLNNYSDVNIHDKKKKIGPRSKSGCWTCRVRHKACPEERPTCSQCSRLNLDCDYSSVRPTYMVDPILQANKLKEIRNITFKQKRNNFTKGGIHG